VKLRVAVTLGVRDEVGDRLGVRDGGTVIDGVGESTPAIVQVGVDVTVGGNSNEGVRVGLGLRGEGVALGRTVPVIRAVGVRVGVTVLVRVASGVELAGIVRLYVGVEVGAGV